MLDLSTLSTMVMGQSAPARETSANHCPRGDVMSNSHIYRSLVPDAPRYKRTEGDEYRDSLFSLRAKSNLILLEKSITPGLQKPRLISTYAGTIEKILFCFPSWAIEEEKYVSAYQSVIQSLRQGTKFVIVHHESIRPTIESWLTSAGHNLDNIDFVPIAEYVSLTDWAEDAYVALEDASDGATYLMEPWEFNRAGDALIADAVEDHTTIKASQAPLIFQGGNCLIGEDFWLLGKDYFVDTIELLNRQRSPAPIPKEADPETYVRRLFSNYVDKDRRLIVLGTRKPLALKNYVGSRESEQYFLDIAAGGVGTFQPIFHIDMFITLIGRNSQGKFEILVGSPRLGDQILGTRSPFSLDDLYDDIAAALEKEGMLVKRNPLVHFPTIGQTLLLHELQKIASQSGYEALKPAIDELSKSGATDNSRVSVRDWHHITWNNCLVENSSANGKHVYLPTFGHEPNIQLQKIDDEMTRIWESLGFTVHRLGDFNEFAKRQGVVHCIKKYLARGS